MAIKPSLNTVQNETFKTIQKFLDHPGPDTFVLKGYVGTGKKDLITKCMACQKLNYSNGGIRLLQGQKSICILKMNGG
jgi:hypothetical protein